MRPERFALFEGLPRVLKYLQMCAGTAVLDGLRAQRATPHESLDQLFETRPGAPSAPGEGGRPSRRTGRGGRRGQRRRPAGRAGAVGGDRARGAGRGRAHRPLLLVRPGHEAGRDRERRPDLFAGVPDVYRVKRNVLERLRRNPAIRRFVEDVPEKADRAVYSNDIPTQTAFRKIGIGRTRTHRRNGRDHCRLHRPSERSRLIPCSCTSTARPRRRSPARHRVPHLRRRGGVPRPAAGAAGGRPLPLRLPPRPDPGRVRPRPGDARRPHLRRPARRRLPPLHLRAAQPARLPRRRTICSCPARTGVVAGLRRIVATLFAAGAGPGPRRRPARAASATAQTYRAGELTLTLGPGPQPRPGRRFVDGAAGARRRRPGRASPGAPPACWPPPARPRAPRSTSWGTSPSTTSPRPPTAWSCSWGTWSSVEDVAVTA